MPEFGKENNFESAIERFFISPEGGYQKGSDTYDKTLALYKDRFINFIKDTQEEKWNKYLKKCHTDTPVEDFCKEFSNQADKKGLLKVLRKGFVVEGIEFKAAYFKPESSLNPEYEEKYKLNNCECYRQWFYSNKNNHSVDMVLVLNGIPVYAFELKNQFTGQSVIDSKKQWAERGIEQEFCFEFNKRILAFFAVDLFEVYMTTEIKGESTFFLPFNQGSNGAGNDGGKGNPQSSKPGKFITSYLWENIFQKDSMLELINRFENLEEKEEIKNGEKVIERKLIFPRYHQIDAVRKIISDVKTNGCGKNFLIQHSAGSGKSNTIAWLSYRLATMYDAAGKEPFFSSVIVITDRRVLDKNLRDTIKGFEQAKGYIEVIEDNKKIANYRDKGKDIAGVIKAGARIVIVTLQTFAANYSKVTDLVDTKNMKFAVIVDEAHESQNGDNAERLKKALADKTLTEEQQEKIETQIEDDDEANNKLVKELAEQGQHKNISFFAFTATPKADTLRVFGQKKEDGKYHPYHIYSMKQAIEEGFILDVLKYYRTYKSHFELIRKIPVNINVNELQASRQIHSFIYDNPQTIEQKSPIILSIFMEQTRKGIVNIETGESKGKMMVVSPSRLAAVRYYLELKRLVETKEEYKGIKILVAFSGEVTDPATNNKYTESGLNVKIDEKGNETHIPESNTAQEFHNNYDILVVADKYQTGFSESYLHTMIVDKKLRKIKAVQTLSRLNRICKNKNSTFILDFANTTEEIQNAFQPFYKETQLEDKLSVEKLLEKQKILHGYGMYTDDAVKELANIYFKHVENKEDLLAYVSSSLKPAYDRFEILLAEDENRALSFRTDLRRFINYYEKVAQVLRLWNTDLYKEYLYAVALLKILVAGGFPKTDITKFMDFKYFFVGTTGEDVFDGAIKLGEEKGELTGGDVASGAVEPVPVSPIDEIIQKINEKFGSKEGEKSHKIIEYLYNSLSANEELIKLAKETLYNNFEEQYFSKFYSKAVVNGFQQNREMFKDFLGNNQLYKTIEHNLCMKIYQQYHEAA